MSPISREELYDRVARLFDEFGYHGTSVRQIAEALGIEKASLYHYTESKSELLLELIRRAAERYQSQLEAIATSSAAPDEKLRMAITRHLQMVARHRHELRVFLHESRFLDDAHVESARQGHRRYLSLLEGILKEGVEKGQFRPVDTRLTALAILGACNWCVEWFCPDGRLSEEQVAEEFAGLFLSGLRR